ncbi:MAG: hypothetical protein FWD67_07770 [Betaproteobacteria bacterium]|nr:hypothetical protein [Betaproteobacteria bacterium]
MLKLKSVATLVSVAALAFCVVTPTFAQSLAQRERYASEDKRLSEQYAKPTMNKCKININVRLDWSTFKDESPPDNIAPSSHCGAALEGISDLCSVSEDAMKAVQNKVTGVTCKEAPPGGLSFENGVLVYGIDFKNDANVRENVRKFLMEKL